MFLFSFKVETDSGIDCPFSNRVYQLSAESKNNEKITKRSAYNSQFSLIFEDHESSLQTSVSDCQHYLKIGCNSQAQNDYSIFKKCQFTDKPTYVHKGRSAKLLKRNSDSFNYLSKLFNEQPEPRMPVTESEYNRMCLAYWPIYKVKQIDEDGTPLTNDPNYITPLNDYFVDAATENTLNDEEIDDVQYIVLTKSSNSETFSITCSVNIFNLKIKSFFKLTNSIHLISFLCSSYGKVQKVTKN